LLGLDHGRAAIAQSTPDITWRMTTNWPVSLGTLLGGVEMIV